MLRHTRLAIVVMSLPLFGCATNQAAGPGPGASATAAAEPNTLTAEEKAAGWQLLFDGKTTTGWHGYQKTTFPEKGWKVENGTLAHEKNEEGFRAGDILTDEEFDNFEVVLDFKVTPRGNSGLKYLVDENLAPTSKNAIGFEFQILDDDLHPDSNKGKDGNRKCGGLYDLIAPPKDKALNPVGQWNTARVIVDGNHIEHWLNGKQTVSYERGSPAFKALVAESKFKDTKGFGENSKGRLLLQDHNDHIEFRNIKIRRLPAKVATTK
jgi:Domain of Unknown Function (DUF1080)